MDHYKEATLLFINPLTRNFQLIGLLKTISILIATARKLALYACVCINCYNMKLKDLQKNYNYITTHH